MLALIAVLADQITITAPPEPEPAATTTLHLDDDPRLLPDLAEVLELAPGAVIRRVGERATIQLRGAGGHQVKILLDGVPLDDGRGGGVDLGHLSLGALESVEVQRGAAAATYGSGAQGGVVRLRTRNLPISRFRLQIGSFGAREADATVLDGTLLAALGARVGEGDFPYLDTNGQRRTRRNNAHGRLDGLVRLRVPVAGGGLSLLGSGLVAGRGEPGLEQFEQLDAHSEARQGLAAAALDLGGVSVQAQGLERRFTFIDPAPAFAGAARRFAVRDSVQGLRVAGETRPGGVQGGLVLEARREVAQTDTAGGDRPGVREEARIGGAATGNLLWNPIDGLVGRVVLRVDDTDAREALMVPAAGVEARLSAVTLRGNLGRLFRDPGFDELYFEAAGLRGNPDLRPEDGWGADLGVGWESERFEVALTGFSQQYDELILYAPLNAWLIQPSNEHEAEAQGLELAGDARWGPVRGRLAGLLQRTKLDGGAQLPFRPERVLTTELRWTREVEVFVGWQWQAEVTIDPFGHRTLPSRHRVDAGVSWAGERLRVGVEMQNLLDNQGILDAVQQPLPGRVIRLGLAWTL